MKYADKIRQSACNGWDQKVVLYAQTNEHTAKIRLNINAIFLDA
jgi:hypothetical protein